MTDFNFRFTVIEFKVFVVSLFSYLLLLFQKQILHMHSSQQNLCVFTENSFYMSLILMEEITTHDGQDLWLLSFMAGFNVEKVQYKNVVFTPWDVGDQQKARPLWRRYFNDRIGLVRTTQFFMRLTSAILHFNNFSALLSFKCSKKKSQTAR